MRKTIYTLLFFSFFININQLLACDPDEATVIVNIHTDNWGYETAWRLVDADGTVFHEVDFNTYADNEYYETEVCVPADACVTFIIEDSYGDGIFHDDAFAVTVDGIDVGSGTVSGNGTSMNFNCPPGSTCSSAIEITEGDYVTEYENAWYVFTPDSVGIYLISTCDNNTCDTKIWVYDDCTGSFDDSNEGTIFYNDNNPSCDDLAVVEGYFAAGTPYIIRIGDADDNCVGTPINFSLNYLGPIAGCTDPASCNYNPLASIEDGSCLPMGDPDCPNAPDLVLRQDVLETSIYLTTLNATDECLIEEGCLQGFGMRDIIRFTTHIENNGEADYLIGEPTENPEQFTYDNCHDHYHYDGYAEYVLYNSDGLALPIGFKNGFCVLDLVCDNGGTAQYGCSYMGITAGCGDIYGSGLDCQWIDVTDVEDGFYTFVTRVNWDNAPDALGRVETDTLNNWAQVCISLDRSSGELVFELVEDCPDFVDCAGEPFGDAQPDCNGVCNGGTLMGDLDVNAVQEMMDAQQYVNDIITNSIEATNCNDLNADGAISVYDAALLAGCLNYGAGHNHPDGGEHDHCDFPTGTLNPSDTVALSILDYNQDEQYVDIAIQNPTASVVAYQFEMSGINLISAENLVDASIYPISPKVSLTDGTTIGISYDDSLVIKQADPQPLVRLYFTGFTDTLICISNIVDIINQDYHQTVTRIDGPCIAFVDVDELYSNIDVKVDPNPFTSQTRLSFFNTENESFELQLMNSTGQVVRSYSDIRNNAVDINRGDLPAGVYIYSLKSESKVGTGKVVVQ